jgi:glycosyltransferase involved in cell wall biosynthesis
MNLKHPTIIHIITDLGDGGAQAVLFQLCKNDKHFRHIVISLANFDKYGPMLQKLGVLTFTIGMSSKKVNFAGLVQLFKILKQHRPAIVQTWMYHADLIGGLTARLAGCPRILWNIRHTELLPGSTGPSTRVVAKICSILSRILPNKIIACGHRAKEVHISMGYTSEKFVVIPNGVPLERFFPSICSRNYLRREFGIPSTDPVIGFFGRWNPQKDHKNLLVASVAVKEKFPNLHIVLAGTGCDDNNVELANCIRRYGLVDVVHLLGPRNDIPAVFNTLDLHVLSSSHGEGFPNVVAEAMASSVPCVVTDVGDAAAIVSNTGWIVAPNDSPALSHAIIVGLSARLDSDTWEQRRQSVRERIIQNFSIDTMVAKYRSVWLQCANMQIE